MRRLRVGEVEGLNGVKWEKSSPDQEHETWTITTVDNELPIFRLYFYPNNFPYNIMIRHLHDQKIASASVQSFNHLVELIDVSIKNSGLSEEWINRWSELKESI